MSEREPTSDPPATLDLRSAIRVQANKLLRAISSTATLEDALHAADRAEGLALDIKTMRALNPGGREMQRVWATRCRSPLSASARYP